MRPEPITATLAGARVVSDGARLYISREPGELVRAGLQPQPLVPGEPIVWDGRYELRATGPGLTVRPLGGLAGRLPKGQRDALARVPTAARPSLPALVGADGAVTCPVLAEGVADATAASLVMARFAAACGQYGLETS